MALIVLISVSTRSHAQQATPSPHGDLAEPCATCHGSQGWKPVKISRAFNHARDRFPAGGRARGDALPELPHLPGFSRREPELRRMPHRRPPRRAGSRLRPLSHASKLPRPIGDGADAPGEPVSAQSVALAADCESCHTPVAQGRLTFVNRPTECVQCHLDSYQAAKAPDHVGGGFPHRLQSVPRDLDVAGRALQSRHYSLPADGRASRRAVPAVSRRRGLSRTRTRACVSCHQADYDRTTDPNHRPAQFPTDCAPVIPRRAGAAPCSTTPRPRSP